MSVADHRTVTDNWDRWELLSYDDLLLSFDMKSKTDRRLFDQVRVRNAYNYHFGTVIPRSAKRIAPACEKCGFRPVRLTVKGWIYGPYCPLCGKRVPDFPEELLKEG